MKKAIILAIGVLLVLPVMSMASTNDEPNNDFDHATLLKESAHGKVNFDDTKDIYKFYVAEGLEVRLELKANNDVDMYLYNPEHKGVAYSCGDFYEFIAQKIDTTGYWYAEVVSTGGEADYTITLSILDDQHDGGYDGDAGDRILKSVALFPMEPVDDTPGRGNTGTLEPSAGDKEDWYMFSVCEGQTIAITITPTSDYDVDLLDDTATTVATSTNTGTSPETISYVADKTSTYYMRIYAKDDAQDGTYTMDINLQGQNDGGQGKDAGNTADSAMKITPGTYPGFLSYYDQVDWYEFDVSSGEGIRINIECPMMTDYNLWLYDPDGNMVASATYYSDDTLEYPADVSGTWKLKVDMFPGFDSKWNEYPIPYYKYGSGGYTLTLETGVSVSPPHVIPQPQITPIAQTFVVQNDKTSNKDEYVYTAAIPAANYLENGNRYVSPIVYTGDDTITNWFGTVDDTTQYLLDDWNAYLSKAGKTAKVYNLESDPVTAAANLATKAWSSSDEAVVVVDGSSMEDTVTEVLSKDATLNIQKKVTDVPGSSSKLKELEGQVVYPMFIGHKWGAIKYNLFDTKGKDIPISLIDTKYREVATDWWPYNEDREDLFHPVTLPGLWAAAVSGKGDWKMHIELYSCDRYKIPVTNSDSTLTVTVETQEPTYLWVYLVDPYGNIMAPNIPSWNGAEIPPIHVWYGNKSQGNERTWGELVVNEHTSFTAQVNHPMEGKWTAIVVPRKDMEGSVSYHVKAEIREYSTDRMNYGLSAANGAVIASLKHIPLLYASEDGVPDATLNALNSLGVSKVIFVDLASNDAVNSELSSNYNVERITTMSDVVSKIDELSSENYITVTSFATGDGYFAPAAYLAAYHGAPVVRIGAMTDAAHWADAAATYDEYKGDYYHGCRSTGHLAKARKPIMDYIKNGELPPIGWDENLRWFSNMVKPFQEYINTVGLNREGKEYVGIVAPRVDIRMPFMRAITGNESAAGQIIGITPAEDAAYIARSALYSAIIFGNPYRNHTTTTLMNFADGNPVTTNDGVLHNAYNARYVKEFFSKYGREYRGHCIWDNLLFEFNRGASAYYYVGHGTGGSGVSEHPAWAGIKQDGWHGYEYWKDATPRTPGGAWYDVDPPNQYDIIHFKWCDQLWQNLHSLWVHFSSCTTAWHFGPDIYLQHGALAYYGNCGTGILGYNDLWDQFVERRVMDDGLPLGESISIDLWRFDRDFTTLDPTSIYGTLSLNMESLTVLYGDPLLVIYSPMHWTMPEPVDSSL